MFAKILLTAVIALATLVIFRQVSERNKKDRIRVKNKQSRQSKTKNLVWDEKSHSYRAED